MKKIICWIRTLWRTFIHWVKTNDAIEVSGHDFIEQKNGELICEICGERA